jgi:hypothetical protein
LSACCTVGAGCAPADGEPIVYTRPAKATIAVAQIAPMRMMGFM